MPYARIDDRWDDHRKIKRALRREPVAVAMHAMAITYANRHVTDGEVDADWVEERLALMPLKPAQRLRVVEVLLELDLFELKDPETFIVHDFLDWNLSREQRAKLSEQGRRGGRSRGNPDNDGSSPGSSHRSSQGLGQGSSPTENSGSSTPRHATPTPSHTENSNAERRSAVIECFAYWQERCNHKQATLSADRKAKIEARLREGYSVHDIRRAIDGAAHAPFIDDKGKVFDDIELICRKGSKLEDFMGRVSLPVGGQVVPFGRRESPSDLLRAMDAAAAVVDVTAEEEEAS